MSNTQYVYTTMTDGSDLTDVYGPLHAVQLANGTPAPTDSTTHNVYRTGTQAHLVTGTRSLVVTPSLLLLDGAPAASLVLL